MRTPPSSDIEIQETVNDYGDCCWAELVIEDERGYVGIDARSARGVFGIHVVEQWGIGMMPTFRSMIVSLPRLGSEA